MQLSRIHPTCRPRLQQYLAERFRTNQAEKSDVSVRLRFENERRHEHFMELASPVNSTGNRPV
ncbi:MAG: hypothetical protein KGL39_36255 [Patescibacteria group bacterium]|nr:hypothetical protein [Patescibacteria group bacterium]